MFRATVLQGGLTFICRMEVMLMFTFQEVLTFGLFIIALLTYINNIRK